MVLLTQRCVCIPKQWDIDTITEGFIGDMMFTPTPCLLTQRNVTFAFDGSQTLCVHWNSRTDLRHRKHVTVMNECGCAVYGCVFVCMYMHMVYSEE